MRDSSTLHKDLILDVLPASSVSNSRENQLKEEHIVLKNQADLYLQKSQRARKLENKVRYAHEAEAYLAQAKKCLAEIRKIKRREKQQQHNSIPSSFFVPPLETLSLQTVTPMVEVVEPVIVSKPQNLTFFQKIKKFFGPFLKRT